MSFQRAVTAFGALQHHIAAKAHAEVFGLDQAHAGAPLRQLGQRPSASTTACSMANPVSVAARARVVELLAAEETRVLALREGIAFGASGDMAGHVDDHGHDHGHEGLDSHAWLDPENARRWLGLLADELAALDPMASDHAPGPDLYPDLLRAMAGALVTCLSAPR